jgi:hypothetical protein
MLNIGAKTSAGSNFDSEAAETAALARTDVPRIEQKKLATSFFSFCVCHEPCRFNFRTLKL